MYEYFRGRLVDIEPANLVLDVNGVGYQIYMANPYRLADSQGQEVQVYAYHHVGQDSQLLYGFRSKKEKELFLRLIKVSGIGPKSALAILANDDHRGLIQAVEDNNVKFLTQFPGVGKKTAGQLVLDLKGKLMDLLDEDDLLVNFQVPQSDNVALDEAIQALEALGYSQRDRDKVETILSDMEATTTDAYLSKALSLLTQK